MEFFRIADVPITPSYLIVALGFGLVTMALDSLLRLALRPFDAWAKRRRQALESRRLAEREADELRHALFLTRY